MTQAGIALCANGAAGGGGGWALYTTTWTVTETFTSTISSQWAPATTAVGGGGGDCIPVPGSGQIACGGICCASDQYCAWKGQCYPNGISGGGGGGGGGGGAPITTTIITGGQTITTAYSAPYRVTSDMTITQTTSSGTGVIVSQTSTSTGNGTVTGGTAGHLSAGAIAGIVIGTLAGVALLLLICACFLVRGLWHGLLALLGVGGGNKKRRRTETIEEERYSRHGHSRPASVHSRRDTHTGWFGGGGGGRPSNVSGRKEKKKSSGLGWLGLGAAAGTLLLLLGLRKDKKRQNRPVKTRSDVSSSYWSDSYTASSPSEF